MITQSEEEETVDYNVALCTENSMSLEKERRKLYENAPDENVYDVSQSDVQ